MTRRLSPYLLAAALCAGALAAPASAVHWPQQGGDPGRAGHQTLGDGTAPVRPLWRAAGEAVTTAPVITSGSLGEQIVAYGTADGRVHLRRLLTGEAVGPADGILVEDVLAAGAFGRLPTGSASFAEDSGSGPGHLYVAHNTDNRLNPLLSGGEDADIELAVIDERTGSVMSDQPLPGSEGLQISAPLVLTPPVGGRRHLLLIGAADDGAARLFRVEIGAGGLPASVQSVAVPGAHPTAGPSVASVGGELVAAVGTRDGVRTFSTEGFPKEGPASAPLQGTPGAVSGPTGGTAAAPGLYVMVATPAGARVHRLAEADGRLVVAGSSPDLAGTPAPALAVTQEIVAGQAAGGWVVAGTAAGLHVLGARDLQPADGGRAEEGPFAATVPATAGALAFAVRDDGVPVVIDLQDADGLTTDAFAPDPEQSGGGAVGQPAISRGIAVLVSQRGVFAYGTRCGNARGTGGRDDRLIGTRLGDAFFSGDGRDLILGAEGDDCLSGGDDADRLTGEAGGDTLSGGDGNDRLNGGPDADVLSGDLGRDSLSGGPGNDRLDGGPGNDALSGGPGRDVLRTRGGGTDRVRCGPGRDTVIADRADRVGGDCERVRRPKPRRR